MIYLCLLVHFFIQTFCSCPLGFTFYGGQCTACWVQGCAECNNQLSRCDVCMNGGTLTSNTCINCGIFECKVCLTNYTCKECEESYGVTEIGFCEVCIDPFCSICGRNYQKCEVCQTGYGNNEEFECGDCFIACKSCSESNYKHCLSCFLGFGLSLGKCLPCKNIFCSDCSNDYSVCLVCQNISSNINGVCIKCEEPCITCSLSPTYCTSCLDGYFIESPQSVCNSCPMFNKRCESKSVNNTICLSPTDDGEFYFDSPNMRCREICGDSKTSYLICDNSKDIALDGCDNNCSVMDNFSCSVINEITECGYYGILYLDFISFKKEKFTNKFTLTIQIIEPILYSFQTLTEFTAKSMFLIDHPEMNVFTVNFNMSTNELTLNGELLNDFSNFKTINIRFHQSVVEDQIVTIPFTFNDDNIPFYITKFEFFIYYIIFFASSLTTFLAWFSFTMGLVFRKLYGLEVLIMLQLCWMSVVWSSTKTFFIAIYESSPLKFSSSFNLVLFEENKEEISFLSNFPYFESFGIVNKLFINNLNLSALLIILPTLFSLFFYIKLKRQNKPKEIFEFHKIDTRRKNTSRYLKSSLTVLFQGCMALLPYFVWCFLLQIKIGLLIHISSLIMMSFCGVYILWTCILFIWKPYLFDYFRLSFAFKRLALNHWIFHILVLLVVVSFFVMLPENRFVPLIPCTIFMIYTVLYRPYLSKKQNFVSSFNYLVVCCFMVFRILLGHFSIELKTNRIILSMILLFCIVLSLAAIMISNALMITNFFNISVIKKIETATNLSLIRKNIRKEFMEELKGFNINQRVKNSVLNRYKKFLPVEETLKNCSNALNMEEINSMVTNKLINEDNRNKYSNDLGHEIQRRQLKLSDIKKKLMLEGFKKNRHSNEEDENRIIDYQFTYIEEEKEISKEREGENVTLIIEEREEQNVEMVGMDVLKNEYKHINISSIILNYGETKELNKKSQEEEENRESFLQIYEEI